MTQLCKYPWIRAKWFFNYNCVWSAIGQKQTLIKKNQI